jgi:hypothetical protein
LSAERDELEYEIFNRALIKTEPITNDKLLEGNIITYQTKETKDFEGKPFLVLQKRVDRYEWWMRFGHSQKPNYDADPPGYPDDMNDFIYGRTETEEGEYQEVLEQEYGKEFLIKRIEFIPYDDLGEKIEQGIDFDSLKMSRSMKVEVEYRLQQRYGEGAGLSTKKTTTKTVYTMITFINFAVYKETDSGSLPGHPFAGFFAESFLFAIK